MKRIVTIAAEFVSPLLDNDFDSFDMDDDNVVESLGLYHEWLNDLGDIESLTLLHGDNDARLDDCEITDRLCDCFDVEINIG